LRALVKGCRAFPASSISAAAAAAIPPRPEWAELSSLKRTLISTSTFRDIFLRSVSLAGTLDAFIFHAGPTATVIKASKTIQHPLLPPWRLATIPMSAVRNSVLFYTDHSTGRITPRGRNDRVVLDRCSFAPPMSFHVRRLEHGERTCGCTDIVLQMDAQSKRVPTDKQAGRDMNLCMIDTALYSR